MPGTTAIFSGGESRNTLLCNINNYAVVLIGRWKGKDAYKRDDDNLVVKDYKMEMIKHEVLNSVMKDCFGEKMSRIPNFLGTEMMNSKLKKHGIGPRMGCKAQECYKVLNFQHMGNLREI